MPTFDSNWKFESTTAGAQAAILVPPVLDQWKAGDARRAWVQVSGRVDGTSCVMRLTLDGADAQAPAELDRLCAAAGLRRIHYPDT
ncbi:MAG TPA: hypothetical protein VLJ58_15325, partial [Ramlibacter sp.]|nr:hypothetical protein [Ramlibacter sp.]